MSRLRDLLCYLIVVHLWVWGFGRWEPRSLRWRIYFALLPYAGDWVYRNEPLDSP